MPIALPRSLPFPAALLLALAALILAAEPMLWLVETWLDPSYSSIGGYVWVIVCGLFLWSATSRPVADSRETGKAAAIFALTALIRLLGRLTATNVIGALALVADIYALGMIAGLAQRQRALSPGWLALAFAFALPLERLLQRTMGFSLQHLSASGACQLLKVGFSDVACFGTRIAVSGRDVMVDLPCSGARGLVQLLLLFTVAAAIRRPRWPMAFVALVATLLAGIVGNTLRVTLLAIGIARPELGIDVMAQPWHDLVGLFCLALAAVPIVGFAHLWGRHARSSVVSLAPLFARRGAWASWRWTAPRAAVFAGLAALIVALPARPLDVGARTDAPDLPWTLNGFVRDSIPLTDKEVDYFTQYGGGAAKARYGEQVLLVVSTTSPLRHLHAPDECLTGSGHHVERLGLSFADALPSAIYRSQAPDGSTYRVAVTYRSDRGELATSVAEVVWLWMRSSDRTWTAIERISPWNAADEALAFDAAVARALEITRVDALSDLTPHHSTRGWP